MLTPSLAIRNAMTAPVKFVGARVAIYTLNSEIPVEYTSADFLASVALTQEGGYFLSAVRSGTIKLVGDNFPVYAGLKCGVWLRVKTGVDNQNIKTGLFIGQRKIVGINKTFTPTGEDDHTTVTAKIKIFTVQIQPVIFYVQFGDAVAILLHPGNTFVPHLHLLCIVGERAGPTPFVRGGTDQLFFIHFFCDGICVGEHGDCAAQQQHGDNDQQDFQNNALLRVFLY